MKKKVQKKKVQDLTEKELLVEIYNVSLLSKNIILKHNIIGIIKVIIIVTPFIVALILIPSYIDNILENYLKTIPIVDQCNK